MSHLSPERLAALVDDTPSPIEAAHMTDCAICQAELGAQRRLARLAAAAQVVTGPPLSRFETLAPRLRAEGLLAPRPRFARGRVWAMRLAASLALVAGGMMAGRLTARWSAPVVGAGTPSSPATGATHTASTTPAFASPDEAVKTLTAAQQTYQSAAAYLAAQDTSAHFIGLNRGVYEARLAALDEIVATTRAALYRAPQDPMLNQYYLTTLSAREATLRQINQTMPMTRKLEQY